VNANWPAAGGPPPARAVLRAAPEDFRVFERLGFEPAGEGEHVFLELEKTRLNTPELARRVAQLSGVPERDVGYSGMKDRNAMTRQWLSVRLAGKPEPEWSTLEAQGDVRLLQARRHLRKLKRGVHRGNRFSIRLRDLRGDRQALEQRLQVVARDGAPNYFGGQRFGRNGSTLEQARQWMVRGGPRVSRNKRSLFLSALRAHLFNKLLAIRVREGTWNRVLAGEVCMLQGTRSHFECTAVDEAIARRARERDIHPGLPLWGRGETGVAADRARLELDRDEGDAAVCDFLARSGLVLAWRSARLLADDFCWQFCDDGSLQLDFALGAGCYATALLAECVLCDDAGGNYVVNKKELGIE
jgi:tRNA pseudouridine13 synthase